MSYSVNKGRISKRCTFSVQLEAVYYEGKGPNRATSIAVYIVINGERIAYRGREGGIPAWISMGEAVFRNGVDAPGSEAPQ